MHKADIEILAERRKDKNAEPAIIRWQVHRSRPNDPLEAWLVTESSLPLRYRDLFYWLAMSPPKRSVFSASPYTRQKVLEAVSVRAIHANTQWILSTGLFGAYSEKLKGYPRNYGKGESYRAYLFRALGFVTAKARAWWSVVHMTANKGAAPHTLQQFADEIGVSTVWMSQCLKELIAVGRFKRYGGNGGRQPTYYARLETKHPERDILNKELEERYGAHREDNPHNAAVREEAREARQRYVAAASQALGFAKTAPVSPANKPVRYIVIPHQDR